MRTYGTLSRELSCSKSHSSREQHTWSSRWQFSSESREAGLCLALHPAPLATQLVFGGESFTRTVRHEHRRLGAMPRLATGTAHGVDGRRSTTTRDTAASSSTAAFGALPQLCEAYAASAG